MLSQETCFTAFKQSIDAYALPERFTFPFYYQPHPLCLLAAKELQDHLQTQTAWQHNFGLSGDEATAIGKMFGVLLVQNAAKEIGYLAAFSGKLGDKNVLDKFVPPVFDMLTEDGFFLVEQAEINGINQQIEHLEKNPNIAEFERLLAAKTGSADEHIEAQRQAVIEGRKTRKIQRTTGQENLSPDGFLSLQTELAAASVKDKNQLLEVKRFWQAKLDEIRQELELLTDELLLLKNSRKALSNALQQKLFEQYQFLNVSGAVKNLSEIFNNTPQHTPPAGAGECAAPKLLHYAFKQGLTPLAMAEFWWGSAPKSEIRQHKNFYGACQGKCQPILGHMLDGIKMDDNPLLVNPALGKTLDIIYQDEVMLVINKPGEFLSVPGKNIEDSVYLRIKQGFPEATGPLIVHRLDMSTSGLMVIALTKQAHKQLQKQFIGRTVKKRYLALLDGLISEDQGQINLPLRVDLEDRPRQLVCDEYGKPAETRWQVIERKHNQTKVHLYPKTGRTHQLRVHCAHSLGLNTPILGDDLYGKRGDRLHLHAQLLAFNHPVTKAPLQFECDADF